jgi:hypothetical protein
MKAPACSDSTVARLRHRPPHQPFPARTQRSNRNCWCTNRPAAEFCHAPANALRVACICGSPCNVRHARQDGHRRRCNRPQERTHRPPLRPFLTTAHSSRLAHCILILLKHSLRFNGRAAVNVLDTNCSPPRAQRARRGRSAESLLPRIAGPIFDSHVPRDWPHNSNASHTSLTLRPKLDGPAPLVPLAKGTLPSPDSLTRLSAHLCVLCVFKL